MRKLVVLNVIGLIISIGLAGLLVANARSSKRVLNELQSFTSVQVEAGELRTNMIAMSDAMRGYLLDTTRTDEAAKKEAADDALVKSLERLLASAHQPDFAKLGKEIGELDETQLNKIEDAVLELAPKDPAGATKTYFGSYMPVRVKQMAMVDQLQKMAQEGYAREVKQATASMDSTITAVTWVGGFVTLVMLLAFLWSLKTSFGISKNMASETTTLGEMAREVLMAANEVSRMSETLAQGATQQASSLEETSASMEEIAAMTRQNASNSEQAASLMAAVDARMQESNRALDDMLAAMQKIDASGREVAKIIKTIDEIAFQTNILALNAAVESARAGEAGLGFAVVADEVRALAQRSAQAARDTAGLIEASMGNTEEGGRKVEVVAKAITAIAGSVTQVKTLVENVSAASHQQSQGISQVSSALTQMERVTQSTAAAAEESAASSEELKSRAISSSEVVADLQRLMGLQCSVTAPPVMPPLHDGPQAKPVEFKQAA